MSNELSDAEAVAASKGATRTDLRLTRHPVDTPRGRLHRLAASSARAVAEVKRSASVDKDDMLELRDLARRGLEILSAPKTRGEGEALVARLCSGLDNAVFALLLVDVDTVDKLSGGLASTLTQLEAAENLIRDLRVQLEGAEQDVRAERGNVAQLRTLLSRAHATAAEDEAPGSWEAPTRRATLTDLQRQSIEEPNGRR